MCLRDVQLAVVHVAEWPAGNYQDQRRSDTAAAGRGLDPRCCYALWHVNACRFERADRDSAAIRPETGTAVAMRAQCRFHSIIAGYTTAPRER